MVSAVQLCVIFWTIYVTKCLPAEENDTSNAVTPAASGPFDEALVTSILKIVDVKFESISTRIGSMERAMNSLQYYNLRQFRVVNTHLRALDTIMQATHSQMGEIDIDSKETKISIDMLKKELKNMEKVQNAMFDSMEINFEKLEFGTGEKFASLHESIDLMLNSTLQMVDKAHEDSKLPPLIESLSTVLNESDKITNDRLTSLEEKVDSYHNVTMSKLEGVEVGIVNSTNNKTEERSLLETLIDLNDNVLRSIDFYRHTGDLVERIVGATETVADEQDTIRSDLRLFLEVQTNNTVCNRKQEEVDQPVDSNELPNVIMTDSNLHRCEMTFDELNEMADIFRNSTHLTDLWTEMAQMNQFTLRSTVMDLMAEVAKLHEIHEKVTMVSEQTTTTAPNLFTGLMEFDLESISNNTKAVYQIVEAVASNTGWIPYIFHNLQFVESQVNETVKNYKNILQKQETLFEILRSHDRTEALTGRPAMTRGLDTTVPVSPNQTGVISDGNTTYLDKLNIIYRTNVKMHRLIPALTRLLGEPEPFITLVDGRNENEGRVEIYRNGRWGTLCKDIDHVEASYICRHLGYLGGISAGSGFYGAGIGVFWKLNMTCLSTRRCEVASSVEANLCSHDDDASIICDHMVRLDADNRKRRSVGYLSIHHRGNWLNICADNWTTQNADVACRQLGHKSGIIKPTADDPKTVEVDNLWLRNITCSGSEMRLDACEHVIWSRGCESNTPVRISCT
ncbi:uncharacterized protein LOC132561103 [Ylistrum balloti]|uniref:uncharacterized protein LOC132561103 n=1 Tax=Ylistrum balloti TaxID=509963 RepID=UPI002905C19A|nr:uncharacterized protein LOC132561103 [Ylistrum balloti]